MQPLQKLLSGLIDYAGLFPPAGLDMPTVVQNFGQYAQSEDRWMLGRLVVPLARLDEFESAAQNLGMANQPARLSVLTPALDAPEFAVAVEQINAFNASASPHVIDAVEVRVTDPQAVRHALNLPTNIQCFVEASADNAAAIIAACAKLNEPQRVFAKVRTGGVKPEMIPTAAYVADFICECAQAGIGLKATAGLHHPFRAEYPLTYEPGCDVGRMHGFLNVFVGACLVDAHGISKQELTEFLDSAEVSNLNVTNKTIAWRNHTLDTDSICAARNKFITSFGSCSFSEPIDDLKTLKLLPETPNAAH